MKHYQVRLEDHEYEAFERGARERGMALQAAGREAITQWVGSAPPEESPFGEITKQEERALRAVLRFVRDTAKRENVAEDALKSIIRLWGRDKRA